MSMELHAWVATFLLAVGSAIVAGQNPPPAMEERVDAVVRELGSERYQDREAGLKHLVDLPAEALPYLDKALAGSRDPEVISRIQSSIEKLRTKARASSRQVRAERIAAWETDAATKGYFAGAHKGAAWDAAVRESFSQIVKLRDGARPSAWKLYPVESLAPFSKAVDAGCEDPVVVAYCLKIGGATGLLKNERARELLANVYPVILESTYEPAMQLEVVLDYVDVLQEVDPEALLWTKAERVGALKAGIAVWPRVVADQRVPDVVLEELAERFTSLAIRYFDDPLDTLEKFSEPWFKARVRSAGPYAFRIGSYVAYLELLQKDKSDRVEPVPEQLAAAREAAEKAYELDVTDPWAPTAMIQLCDIAGAKREEMEKWFGRARETDPDNFQACLNKLGYLESHAGPDDMVAFGKECVAGGRWQGAVPLTLIAAHERIGGNAGSAQAVMEYMGSDEVWRDFDAVYTKLLAAHKGDVWELYYRSRYARQACIAEKWATAKEQFRILGDHPHIGIFESIGTYNNWRRKAERLGGAETQPASALPAL